MRKFSRRQTLASMVAAGASIATQGTRANSTLGSAARVSILLVNDIYRIDENKDCRGGMARFASAVKTERTRALAEGRQLICVHAGDTLSPSLLSSFDQGAHMIDLFNDVGLDVFVPGNHEFDFGKDTYFERMGEARFLILAANLRDAAGLRLPRHQDQILIEADGLKLALIGAAYEATASASRPGDLAFGPISRRCSRAPRVRARRAPISFVAIVHAEKATGAALMNTHAVDLILSGHNHDLHIDFDGRTAFVESAQDANYVTVVDIDVARTRDEKRFDVEIATLAAPLDSRTGAVRSGESAIGDLTADALRKAAQADIVIINGGGIRGNKFYPAGTKLSKRIVALDVIDYVEALKLIDAKVEGRIVLG